jgi:hypothetical protein
MVLNFDWVVVIENEKITLLILIYFFGYMQSTKKYLILIWLFGFI